MSDVAVVGGPSGGVDGPDIDDEIAEVAGILNAQHGRLIGLVAQALETDGWQAHGIHSPAQWLAWKAGLSPHRAKEIVRCAERRPELPHVSAALDRGELAVDQVVALMKAPAWADERVADFATSLTVVQLRKTITKQFFDEGPDPEAASKAPADPDRLSTGPDGSGRWRISGEGDLARGAIIEAALAEAKDSLFERGQTDATWFDALVEISERSLDAVESSARRDRFRTWIHLDANTTSAATTAGWPIPPSVRDQLLCDGVVQPVWEREGVPFNVGRSQRIVPDRTRRIIERRDQGCRVPGCTSGRYLDIHHIIHWLQGGPTDTWNLMCLCRKHHRQHHQGLVGISGNADEPSGVTFTDHLGRPIAACGKPKIPDRAPPNPAGRYKHPSGERMDYGYFQGWVHPEILRARRNRNRQ